MPDLENKKRKPITQCSPAVICNKSSPAVHSIVLLTASVFVRPTNNRTYKCTYEIETTAHADRGRARTTHVEARTARCWACSSFSRAVALRLSQQIVRLRLGSSSCCPVISPPPVSGLHHTMIGAASMVISHQRHHDVFFSVSLVINPRRVPPPFSAPFFLLDWKEAHVSSRLSTSQEENKTKRILEQAHSGWADRTVIRWSTKQPYTRENIAASSARLRANETRPRLAAW